MNHSVFVSGYWNTNLGDDLFLFILCDRYPNQKFTIYTDKRNSFVFRGIKNLNIIEKKRSHIIFNKLFSIIQQDSYFSNFVLPNFDTYVEIGGSIFMESKNWKSVLKSRNAIRNKIQNYLVIGCNFGPFQSSEFLTQYQKFFKDIDIVFRDKSSASLFQSLNKRFHSDVVFLLSNLVKEGSIKVDNVKNNSDIVISVIDFQKSSKNVNLLMAEQYECKIVEIINFYVLQKNKSVVLIGFCKNEGDEVVIDRILSKLNPLTESNVRKFIHNNVEQSLGIIYNCEKIIATRFHANILGWLFEKPTLSISYNSKLDNFVQGESISVMSLSEFIALELDNFENKYNKMDNKRRSIFTAEATKQFSYLDQLLKIEASDYGQV